MNLNNNNMTSKLRGVPRKKRLKHDAETGLYTIKCENKDCKKEFKGRKNKKYCSNKCKNFVHNQSSFKRLEQKREESLIEFLRGYETPKESKETVNKEYGYEVLMNPPTPPTPEESKNISFSKSEIYFGYFMLFFLLLITLFFNLIILNKFAAWD